jgi:tRNA A37 N6-isopentenylltransferase MiaA
MMIERGLIQETRDLIDSGKLLKDSSPGRSIGYQETIKFIETVKDLDLPKAITAFEEYLEAFQAVTRQYSRRQEHWFRRMPEFKWIKRVDFSKPLPPSMVDLICKWYQLRPEMFSANIDLKTVDTNTREEITSDPITNRKRMKTYTSNKAIFGKREEVEEFLTTRLGLCTIVSK